MSEMKSLTLNGTKYDSFVDKTARKAIEEMEQNGTGGTVSEEQIAQAVEDYMAEHPVSGGGMSATASALLINILRNGVYGADQSANITALEAALASGGGGTDEPDTPDTPVEPGVTYYTIVNVLTNVTNSNSTAKVSEGASYIGTLTAADGFNMSAVTVTMGGVDVTADVYADGTITIESVTGNVIITASAVEDSATAPAFQLTSPLVLGDASDPRINDTDNCRIATGETVNDDESWTICVDFTSIAGTACNKQSVAVNENNQVSIGHTPTNWVALAHGIQCGIIQNEWDVGKFKGLNWVAIFTHDGSTKTFNVYGTGTGTKTFDEIRTPADGQLYVGHADAIGTINRFALYKRVLSSDEITEWIGG